MRRPACKAAIACLLVASPAAAQTADAQLAQSLFERGRALMADGKFVEACPMLAESERLDPGGGTLLNLAVCHEGEGKTATAWAEFNVALSAALKDGRKDREELARSRIDALKPRLSHLTVMVPKDDDIEGLAITLDDAPLRRAAWGVETAVDPGVHHVRVTVEGNWVWEQTVSSGGAGEAKTVALPVPLVATPPVVNTSPASPHPSSWRTGRLLGYTALGVGGAGLVVMAVSGAFALSDKSSLEQACGSAKTNCPSSSQSDITALHASAITSDVALGVGVAGVGAGAVLLLLSRSKEGATSGPRATHVEPWMGVGRIGVRGQF